jgi:putative ABC transport system permease protein
MPWLRRAYRVVILTLPPGYRRLYGAEMEDVFVHCLETERRRHPGTVWLTFVLVRATIDALILAASLRRDGLLGRLASDGDPAEMRRSLVRTHELRLVFRLISRRPFFAASIVFMLALGIGATSAIFSVVSGVLLRPLPFPHPDRLVSVWASIPSRNLTEVTFSEANFWDVRDLNRSFDALGAWHGASFTVTGGGTPERVDGARVSVDFFRALSPRLALGQLFQPGDDDPGAPGDRVLLSHRFWVRRYGADPAVVGTAVTLDGRAHTIVGVLPPGSPWLERADAFVPFVRRPDGDRGSWEYLAVGRLRDGMTLETARADLARVMRELEARHPDVNTGMTATVESSAEWIAGPALRQTLWTLFGATGLLLLIACVNVANLLLAHASARGREMAIRAALGASRFDLVRERMTEAGALSVLAAVAGTGVAWGMLQALKALDPGGVPRLASVGIDAATLAFTAAVALVVAVITGLVPALRAPVAAVQSALGRSPRGAVGSRHDDRLRRALVAVEVALSLTLLVGAGLLVRSLVEVLSADRGFQTDRRLVAVVSMPGAYPGPRRAALAESILARVRALPDVVSAAAVSGVPLLSGSTGLGIVAADSDGGDANVPWATWRIVTKEYFETMGLPLVAGRGFTEHDIIEKPWRLIVSKRLADELWPGQNPVGRTALLWKGQGNLPGEVIGVVGDMRERGLEAGPTMAVYFPAYGALGGTTLRLVMHTRTEPLTVAPMLQAAVRDLDPTLPISGIRTLDDLVGQSIATRRFTMVLLSVFAVLAVLLSSAGVYGVLAYTVSRRTAEIGVRLALGASPRQVLVRVFSDGMTPVIAGVVLGAAAAFWGSRVLASLLYEIRPDDPLTYVAVTAALVCVAALACYIPARRVLRVDPSVALRTE